MYRFTDSAKEKIYFSKMTCNKPHSELKHKRPEEVFFMQVTEFKSFDEMPMFLSIPQAAKILKVSDKFLYNYSKEDSTFPVIEMGRRRVVPSKQLEEWINEQIRKRGE